MGLLWPLRSQFTKLRSFSRGPEIALGSALFCNKEEKQLFEGWGEPETFRDSCCVSPTGLLICLN